MGQTVQQRQLKLLERIDEVNRTKEPSEIVFEALKKFINQRAKLERANYGCEIEQLRYSSTEQRVQARAGMRSDARTISKDGTRARKALAEALTYPFNAEAMADAFKSAFSGRLSWDGSELDYCTGQYYPTEYRAAAATVLERYNYTVKPKFMPEKGEIFTHSWQIEEAATRAGSHYFERGTKRFFRSRTCSEVFHGNGGVFFVTSEQFVDHRGVKAERRYTVRKFNPENADISSFGPFNKLSKSRALRVAKIASEYPEAALESLADVKESWQS